MSLLKEDGYMSQNYLYSNIDERSISTSYYGICVSNDHVDNDFCGQ